MLMLSDYNKRAGSVLVTPRRLSPRAYLGGIPLLVTEESVLQLLESQGYRCAISGVPIGIADSVKGHKQGQTTASLDRIDSRGGYTPDNIQWLHKDVNKMKWDMPQSKFIQLCKLIAGRNQ